LEIAGFAFFDMYPERRGNLFADHVYRLTKAKDATTTYPRSSLDPAEEASTTAACARFLLPNHKFTNNDIIMLTLQPSGSGDFFSPNTVPTSENAIATQARVLNSGPTYLDICLPAGMFGAAFGPAPNDWIMSPGDQKNKNLRLRVDKFFSDVPYQRMVTALTAITSIPERSSHKPKSTTSSSHVGHTAAAPTDAPTTTAHGNIAMDEVLREMILQVRTCVCARRESIHTDWVDTHSPSLLLVLLVFILLFLKKMKNFADCCV
jgi:hypothetical protein